MKNRGGKEAPAPSEPDERAFFGAAAEARPTPCAMDADDEEDADANDSGEEEISDVEEVEDVEDHNLDDLTDPLHSLSFADLKTPTKAATKSDRIETVEKLSDVKYPIFNPECTRQKDGRRVAVCSLAVPSDTVEVEGKISGDRRTISLTFTKSDEFLHPHLTVAGLEETHPSFSMVHAEALDRFHKLPEKQLQVLHSPFDCEEDFYAEGIGKPEADGLILCGVIADSGVSRHQVEFAVVEHKGDTLKSRSASKAVYNHQAETQRKENEQTLFEEFRRQQQNQAEAAERARQANRQGARRQRTPP